MGADVERADARGDRQGRGTAGDSQEGFVMPMICCGFDRRSFQHVAWFAVVTVFFFALLFLQGAALRELLQQWYVICGDALGPSF